MKALLLGILLLALEPASAPQPHRQSASIEVDGVTLRLGMTKAQVEERFNASQILKSSQDGWLIGDAKELIHFTGGRLTFAERGWPSEDNDIGEQLFGAVSSLNEEGFDHCKVLADVKTDPGSTLHRTWIDCGEKSVLVLRYIGVSGKMINTVQEQLGRLQN